MFVSPAVICFHCLTFCYHMFPLPHLLLCVSIASPSAIICFHCLTFCNRMFPLPHLLLSYVSIALPFAIIFFHCLTFCNHMFPLFHLLLSCFHFLTLCNHVASLCHLLQTYGSTVSLQISELQNHREVWFLYLSLNAVSAGEYFFNLIFAVFQLWLMVQLGIARNDSTVIPRLTKIICSGITFINRNLR